MAKRATAVPAVIIEPKKVRERVEVRPGDKRLNVLIQWDGDANVTAVVVKSHGENGEMHYVPLDDDELCWLRDHGINAILQRMREAK